MGKKFNFGNFSVNALSGAAWAGDRDQKEMWKFGAPYDPQAWNRYEKDKAYRKEKFSAGEAANLRADAQRFLADIARNRRASYLQNYRPIEDELVNQARIGTNPDYNAIRTEAMGDVGAGYGIQAGINQRHAARYGIDPSRLEDPALVRETELARTADEAYAGDSAVDSARARAEALDAGRGLQALGLGSGQADLAGSEYAAGTTALADLWDYDAMSRGRRTQDQIAGDKAGAQAIGSIFGGIFGGMGKADGGLVALGGRSGKTIDLRKQYTDYRIEASEKGGEVKEWPDWLDDQGYVLDKDNLVRPKYADGGRVGRSRRPRMGITGVHGTAVMPKRYAAGGVIDGTAKRVELESGDYIMPADVVDALGVDYFDRMVEEHMPRHYAGGGLIYPGMAAANLVGGFTQGMKDAEDIADRRARREAYKEDREYQRGERAYQEKQRQRAESAYERQQAVNQAALAFDQSQGTNFAPIIDVQRKYFGNADMPVLEPNPDGTYNFSVVSPDGQTLSPPRKISRAEASGIGLSMLQVMRDPDAYFKSLNDKPTTVNTPYGGVTHAYDPRTRKWNLIEDNNSDARAKQGGRGGLDVLGWKDHNQMNDDIQRLAFKRFAVPNPNGIGSILDPEGQLKAKMFKDLVFSHLDKLGKSPRELTSSELNAAAGAAETAVEQEFRRRNARGIQGSGRGFLNLFDADKAAADMVTYFPEGGSEPELRQFMAKHDITDPDDQNRVLAKMRTYIGPKAGMGTGLAAPARPGQRTAADVKADYKSGRISREQAINELKAMGFQ